MSSCRATNANPFIVSLPDGRVISPTMVQSGNGEREGQQPRIFDIRKPITTIVAQGQKHRLVAACLVRHYGGKTPPQGIPLSGPLSTITTKDHHGLVTATLGGAKDYRAEVRSFLDAHRKADNPQMVLWGRASRYLVNVNGVDHEITDIGTRLLGPRELYRGQGFPESYIIDPIYEGEPITQEAQIRMVGNSVPPHVVEAIVRANIGIEDEGQVAA